MYPELFACKVNINMRGLGGRRQCTFNSYNYGIESSNDTSSWDEKRGDDLPCMLACPAARRTTRDLKGTGVARWGGIYGMFNIGHAKLADEHFELTSYMWKMDGDCSNPFCRNIFRPLSLIDKI